MKTVTEIYQEIYPILEEMEQKRLEFLAKGRKIIYIGGGIAVLIGLVWLVALTQTGDLPHLFLILGILTVIGCSGYYVHQRNKVINVYKSVVIPKIISSVDSSYYYNAKRYINESQFKESQLFKKPDRYNGEDYISGRLGETDFQLSEIHAEYESGSDYEDGSSSYSTIFKGFFMVADFHQDFQGHTIVVPDNKAVGIWGRIQQAIKSQGMETAEMEDVDFEDKFDVFTTDQEEARNILSMSMIENIVKLKEKFDSKIYIAFLNSCIYIAIEWKLNIFEPNLHSTLLDENTIHGFLDEIWMCLEIIEDLDLNKKIWTKA